MTKSDNKINCWKINFSENTYFPKDTYFSEGIDDVVRERFLSNQTEFVESRWRKLGKVRKKISMKGFSPLATLSTKLKFAMMVAI